MNTLQFNIPNKTFPNNAINRNNRSILLLPLIVVYNYFCHNYENMYFLILAIFQLLTLGPFPASWSPTGPFSTAIPLVFCVLLEIITATYTWIKNYMIDNKDNSRIIDGLHHSVANQDIYPGTVIKCYKDDVVPCDGILVDIEGNSKYEKYAKISLALLTGESNVHFIEKIDRAKNVSDYTHKNTLEIDRSHKKFSGKLDGAINVTDSSFICNNAIIKSPCVYIWVTACGSLKKNAQSYSSDNTKVSRLDVHVSNYMTQKSSKMLVSLILFVSCVKLLFSDTISLSTFGLLILQNWICFNGIIPYAVKIFLILVRNTQAAMINRSFDNITVNNNKIVDDIVKVDKIICDKTGTLTKNELDFSKLIECHSKEVKDVSGNNTIDTMFLTCLGVCIHQSDGSFNTIEDQVIRYRYQLLNSRVEQNGNAISIIINDEEQKFNYVELAGLDFTFDRKMSSKVVVNERGKYYIFVKGSLDKVRFRLNKKYTDELGRLDKLISENSPDLRLLACAYREVNGSELNKDLSDSFHVINNLENNLILLGIIGIKDNIQEDVHKTITMLREQNIYCCMCTGDRKITALAVAKETGIISDADATFDLECSTFDDNKDAAKTLIISGTRLENCMNDPVKKVQLEKALVSNKNFVGYGLIPNHKRILTDMLERNNIKTMTIGDGFNDIAMFDRSQVSVSIKGTAFVNETSDFVVNKFRDLIRLFNIGVDHYYKNTTMSNHIFYRCVAVVMCLATYSLLNYDKSTVSVFSGFVIQAFNFLWCIAPLMLICLTQNNSNYFNSRDLGATKDERRSSPKRWIIEGVVTGVMTTLLVYMYYGGSAMFNDLLAFAIICIVNMRLVLYLHNVFDILGVLIGPMMFVFYMAVFGSKLQPTLH
jgi:magnesium-transporting ATPase (P-type)